jgi:hypothetical protein
LKQSYLLNIRSLLKREREHDNTVGALKHDTPTAFKFRVCEQGRNRTCIYYTTIASVLVRLAACAVRNAGKSPLHWLIASALTI